MFASCIRRTIISTLKEDLMISRCGHVYMFPSSPLLGDHEELKYEFHFSLRFPAVLQLSVMFLFTDVAFATLFHKDVEERSF